MTRAQLRARAERLEELAVGLGKELTLWRGKDTPLTDKERRQYLREIQNAIAGAYAARMTLVKVEERLERDGEQSS